VTRNLRIVVDRDLCDANGVCVMKAPLVFAIDEDDRMRVLAPYPSQAQLENVHAAVQGCPKGALSLRDE
jgi:ferredoxin